MQFTNKLQKLQCRQFSIWVNLNAASEFRFSENTALEDRVTGGEVTMAIFQRRPKETGCTEGQLV